MICEKCNASVREDAKFCDNCGEEIVSNNKHSQSPISQIAGIDSLESINNSPKKHKKKKSKKVFLVILCLIIIGSLIGGILFLESEYNMALKIQNSYPIQSYNIFDSISWYKDSHERKEAQKENILKAAKKAIKKENFSEAKEYLDFLDDYPGVSVTRKKLSKAKKEYNYKEAVKLFNAGLYDSAKDKFDKLQGYKDVDTYLNKFAYKLGDYYSSSTMYQSFSQMYFSGWDSMIMYKDGSITTYLYIVVESDDEYQCSLGDYEIWLMGEIIDGEKIYYDFVEDIIGINNPQYNDDGLVVEFNHRGMRYLENGV